MKVIAISGWKRSGKDTAAAHLVANGFTRAAFADVLKDMVAQEYNIPRSHCDDPDFKEKAIMTLPVIPKDEFTLAMAKIMFREFRTADGHPAQEFHIDASGTFLGVLTNKGVFTDRTEAVQLYWTPRALCILKGSVNRAVDSSYWVQRAIDVISHASKNEFTGQGGNFVISDLRYRSEVDQLRQAFGKNLITVRINRFSDVNSSDPSERDLDNHKFDITIDNVGTLEELYMKLDAETLSLSLSGRQ